MKKIKINKPTTSSLGLMIQALKVLLSAHVCTKAYFFKAMFMLVSVMLIQGEKGTDAHD